MQKGGGYKAMFRPGINICPVCLFTSVLFKFVTLNANKQESDFCLQRFLICFFFIYGIQHCTKLCCVTKKNKKLKEEEQHKTAWSCIAVSSLFKNDAFVSSTNMSCHLHSCASTATCGPGHLQMWPEWLARNIQGAFPPVLKAVELWLHHSAWMLIPGSPR